MAASHTAVLTNQQIRVCISQVYLLPSFTDGQRAALLTACVGVLYTPQHEHFGIVPLEAMASGRPVIACNSGGPTESVLSGVTGFLCGPSPSQFADAMGQLLVSDCLKSYRVCIDCTNCGSVCSLDYPHASGHPCGMAANTKTVSTF